MVVDASFFSPADLTVDFPAEDCVSVEAPSAGGRSSAPPDSPSVKYLSKSLKASVNTALSWDCIAGGVSGAAGAAGGAGGASGILN